jgi:hypothetical protein
MRSALAPVSVLENVLSLRLEREDIHFRNLSPTTVEIEATVTNDGDSPSAPSVAVVSAAVLGAFVPWQPLTALAVPALEPGESAVLRGAVPAPTAAPLGTPDRVTPQQLLTALGLSDDPGTGRQDRRLRRARAAALAGLPADPLRLLSQGGLHWAGNLNVFIRQQPVERHLAQALRIYPGRLNAAMFCVGSGRDSYRFHLQGNGADWNPTLYDLTAARTLEPGTEAVGLDVWVNVTTTRMLMLTLRPPAGCGSGTVEVHVTQRSTDQTAVVEFSLDPTAAGPGCFVVR